MKKFKILALILALLIVFSGCGASSMDSYGFGNKTESYYPQEAPMAAEPEMGWADMDMVEVEEDSFNSSTSSSSSVSADGNAQSDVATGARKLIRTFDLDVETLEFDSFVSEIKKAVNAMGGYIENSSVSGNSYNYSSNRNASFSCRIPSAKLMEFVDAVGNLGNVTYSHEDARDITLSYVDTEARVASLQTEYDRLLELLAEAETVDTVIMLEQRLSDVRYQLESYKSQLRTYDNLVDYSTVNLNVNEVKRVTSPEKESVWERISSDFSDNVYTLWVGLQDFFVWFVASTPVFALLAVIAFVIFLIVKACLNLSPRYRERQKAKKAAKAYKKAQEKAAAEAKTEEAKE